MRAGDKHHPYTRTMRRRGVAVIPWLGMRIKGHGFRMRSFSALFNVCRRVSISMMGVVSVAVPAACRKRAGIVASGRALGLRGVDGRGHACLV